MSDDLLADMTDIFKTKRLPTTFKVSKVGNDYGISAKLLFFRKYSRNIVILKENYIFAFQKRKRQRLPKKSFW